MAYLPIIFGASTCSHFYRDSQLLQTSEEFPTRHVDGCYVFERGFRLSLKTFERLGLVLEKHGNILRAFLAITGFTGQAQITDTIGPAFATSNHMFYLKRDIAFAAITTLTPPLFQQVLSDFVAQQFPLLVGDAASLRVLHGLRIEAHQFLTDRSYRTETL